MFGKQQYMQSILKSLVKGLVAALAAVGVAYFVGAQVSKISETLVEKKHLSVILEHRSDTIRQLRSDFAVIGGADTFIANAFPSEDNILDFTDALEATAKEVSMTQSLNIETPTPSALGDPLMHLSTINYTINLNGGLEQFIAYLRAYEELPYFAFTNSVNLSTGGNGWLGNSAIGLKGTLFAKQVPLPEDL